MKARRTENESAAGCRADLVDNGLIKRDTEQGPTGLAARFRAVAELNELGVRFDRFARLVFVPLSRLAQTARLLVPPAL